MCGIAGIIHSSASGGESPRALSAIQSMLAPLSRRGPDASGGYHKKHAALGHTRLSIIDLSNGKQPMVDDSAKVVLTFNGEIYNFRQLRKQLQASGHQFKTDSDTEVLLRGYIEWGENVVSHLNGMFAFALWDEAKQTLFVARDRTGQKPLFWNINNDGEFVFASELSSLVRSDYVKLALNKKMLRKYLLLSYLPGEESALENINRLPAGQCLRWSPGEKAPHVWKYWDLAEIWRSRHQEQLDNPKSDAEFEEQFAETLEDAVKVRMISDVPLGSFLSSGIDSAVVSAFMKKHRPELKTFNIGFAQKSFDESGAARETAECIGSDHHSSTFTGCSVELLQEIASNLDEPFADTSIIPTYFLCGMAKEHMTVALTGDGADELLAGYPTLQADKYYASLKCVPQPLVKMVHGFLNLVPDSRGKVNFMLKAKQFLRAFPASPVHAHASWRMVLPEISKTALNENNELDEILASYDGFYESVKGVGNLDEFLYIDYMTWLQDDILVKADRASMNNSLELRAPFLDHRIIELSAAIPERLKLHKGRNKVILRNLAQKLLPEKIINRKKTGFNSPVSFWLCETWRDLTEAEFSSGILEEFGLLDSKLLLSLWSEHKIGKRDHGFFLFSVLLLSIWLRKMKPDLT